ncbi:MAG: saccharopine dehydrogenase C-terminal domain-containing protein [Aeromonas popoffii]|uniref:saccharopine dehydrogenase C-terminal domain-containing protein n=1 Tax=Aeromonas popoffii TaxID=70856 RepID=UPI003F32EEA4
MTKRIGLIGCGNLGYPLAHFIGLLGFDELYVHDLEQVKASSLKQQINAAFPSMKVIDHLDANGLDIIVLSLSGPQTTAFVSDTNNHALFRGRPVFISLGRPNYDDPAAHAVLQHKLAEQGVSLLFGFGLEPGLVEIMMHYLASIHEGEIISLEAICGGVPQRPILPLSYDLLFGERLPSLNRHALFKFDGRLGGCKRFDMKENVFIEGVGALEVFHDGLSPYFLTLPCISSIANIKQQTARWPSFFECMRTLLALGMLDEDPLPDGTSPSALTHAILRQNGKLARNRPDVSFAQVTAELASGQQVVINIVSTFCERTQLTGMAQLTSFVAAWAAKRVMERPESARIGMMLGYDYFDVSETLLLLDAFREYANCTVHDTF